jgi:hypothetical protein
MSPSGQALLEEHERSARDVGESRFHEITRSSDWAGDLDRAAVLPEGGGATSSVA